MNRHNLQGVNWHFDKILFAVGSVYLAVVVGWLLSKDKLKLPFISKQASSPLVEPAKSTSSVNSQFTAYLERSLKAIDRRSKAAQKTPPTPPTVAIPPAIVSSNQAPPPQKPNTVIEKVYVPVYPQNQAPYPAASATNPQSSPSTQPTVSLNSNAASEGNKAGLTLVGLLESGDRSSALFKMNDTTRRIEPGKVIGTSGWTLVSVQNQQAIVYANGKTRSLEVGQGF